MKTDSINDTVKHDSTSYNIWHSAANSHWYTDRQETIRFQVK